MNTVLALLFVALSWKAKYGSVFYLHLWLLYYKFLSLNTNSARIVFFVVYSAYPIIAFVIIPVVIFGKLPRALKRWA